MTIKDKVKPKIIPDAKFVALRSHSMWAIYLGILALWAPDLIYLFTSIDTNPHLWIIISQVLLIYGAFGRFLRQGYNYVEDLLDGDDN